MAKLRVYIAFVTNLEAFIDLASYEILFAVCTECSRAKQIDRYELAKKYGLYSPINAIRPKLKCNACDRKTVSVVGKANGPRD
ncbi:hypothetical protein [Phyllobacterium myrsinacearum]|uniref:Uncharacterized protein n=1 Tax=Phyllobacterium myrsinacearum TaxID=28101 RepID=A0A839EBI7_9HYPH|nr:hypothetical protein [Phyllobacterium myrsinacearum]MBA8876322.1 hypothetical protein [Phyllobacterium myrsinacearum]